MRVRSSKFVSMPPEPAVGSQMRIRSVGASSSTISLTMGSEGADYINGGDGYDVVDYSNSPRGDGFFLDGVDIDLSSGFGIVFGEGGHAEGDIVVNVEAVVGSRYDDGIDVGDIWGGSIFDDPISHRAYGGPGDDTLRGYERDYLSGGPGDDTLISHDGGTVRGGPGADTFEFFGDVQEATIEDFNPDDGDQIELSFVGFSDVTKSDVQTMLNGSSGSVLDLSLLGDTGFYEHGTITLEGIQVSDLSVNDFIIG